MLTFIHIHVYMDNFSLILVLLIDSFSVSCLSPKEIFFRHMDAVSCVIMRNKDDPYSSSFFKSLWFKLRSWWNIGASLDKQFHWCWSRQVVIFSLISGRCNKRLHKGRNWRNETRKGNCRKPNPQSGSNSRAGLNLQPKETRK